MEPVGPVEKNGRKAIPIGKIGIIFSLILLIEIGGVYIYEIFIGRTRLENQTGHCPWLTLVSWIRFDCGSDWNSFLGIREKSPHFFLQYKGMGPFGVGDLYPGRMYSRACS
jgi:hypothetical protein